MNRQFFLQLFILLVHWSTVARATFPTSTYAGQTGATIDTLGDGRTAQLQYLSTPRQIWKDTSGNIYVADSSRGRVRMVSSSGILSTFCGGGTGTSDLSVANTAFPFISPWGVTGDNSGNVYVTDYSGHYIAQCSTTGISSRYIGVRNAGGYNGELSSRLSTNLWYPTGIHYDPKHGRLYFTDSSNQRVRYIDQGKGNNYVELLAGYVNYNYDSYGNIYSSDYLFANPMDVWVNAQGTVFVVDSGFCVLWEIHPTTLAVTRRVGYQGSCQNSGDGGNALSDGYLLYPVGVCGDADGNLYIMQEGYGVRGVSGVSGVIATFVGGTNQLNRIDGINAKSFRTVYSYGCFVESTRDLIFPDSEFGHVLRVRAPYTLNTVTSVVGYLTGQTVSTDGPLFRTSNYGVWGNTAGEVFFTDNDRGLVMRISQSGQFVSAIAGVGVSSCVSSTGVIATTTSICTPRGIVGDTLGNIYFSEYSNHRVRRVSTSGVLTTVMGFGGCGYYPGYMGVGSGAYVCYPGALAMDPSTNNMIYVAVTYGGSSSYVTLGSWRISDDYYETVLGNNNGGGTGGGYRRKLLEEAQSVKLEAMMPAQMHEQWWYAPYYIYSMNSIWVAQSGVIYFADNARVYWFNKVTGIMGIGAGVGSYGTPTENGSPSSVSLGVIDAICGSSNGDLFIAQSTYSYRISIVRASTNWISTYAGNGGIGLGGEGVLATTAPLGM
eukprot:gene24218-29287_t